MTNPDMFKVVETVRSPGSGSKNEISATVLSRYDLSAQFPRARAGARSYGGLTLIIYDLETGTYDSESHEERIEPLDSADVLREDPRLFDDELDPTKLPEGYRVGEGYAAWQERTTPPYFPVRYIELPRSNPDSK